MNKPNLTPSLAKFADKVRIMNQSQTQNLSLTANEARNIESDIMILLMQIVELQNRLLEKDSVVEINLESPGFKN